MTATRMSVCMAALGFVCAMTVGVPVRADPIKYTFTLSGAAEDFPNLSPATGTAEVIFDAVAHTLAIHIAFTGLTSGNTAAHIHCCTTNPFLGTAGVATTTPTFTGFPSGATAGTYDYLFDLALASSWNASFLTIWDGQTKAEAALGAGLAAGKAYLNIHTTNYPAGEIRGFAQAIPEPATLALLGIGFAGLAAARRRKSRQDARPG